MNVANILNYLFHFSMARMLGPSDYGILAVLTSIIYLFSVPTNSIQTVVSKYTTRFKVKKEEGKIKGILNYLLKMLSLSSLICFGIFLVISIFLYEPLKISYWLLVVTGLVLFGTLITPIGTGILQGSKRFGVWGWNTILNSGAKLVLAILLVYFGFGVYGPVIGFLFGALVSFIMVFPFIKEILQVKEIKEKVNVFSEENIPTFIAVMIITLMYSLDIILAKYLFDARTAGLYSVASMIGKMIFFASATIASAMFPISSEKFLNGNKEKTLGVARKTSLAIGALCGFAVLMLWLFPSVIIGLLFGKQYLEVSSIMLYVGIAYSMLSFLNTYVLYKISVNEFSFSKIIFLVIFLLIQVGVIIYFGNSINKFVTAFLLSTIISFIGTVILIRKWKR
jgi:O-antigen/teichoic acid export membrane protein